MKKFILMTLLLVFGLTFATAQNQAEIKFDKVSYDFGTFSENNPVHKTTFTCTIPRYDKRPIAPGQKGSIDVTYNGTGKFPGHFKKSITVRTNGKNEMTRLYIEGVMEGK